MVVLLPFVGLLVCAGGAWLLGLGIRRTLDAPALTARIQRHRRRCAFLYLLVTIACAYGVVVLWRNPTFATLALPSAIVYLLLCAAACNAGDYALRRDAFGERCSFGASVAFTLRSMVGLGAFWVVLLATPFVVQASAPHGWMAAGAMFLLLFSWAWRSVPAAHALLGIRPIDDADLRARFDEVLARSSAAPLPLVARFGPAGAAWVNAFALPHDDLPSVVFTTPMLERLTPAESTAIFAHEVAHLEDYDSTRLRKIGRMQTATLVLACFIGPLAALAAVPWSVVAVVWTVGFVFFLVRRAAGMKPKETESDRRAIELCGDAEALARALEKLHALNRVPRRLDVETERASTHPSLARRLAAIRRHADGPAPVVATIAFRTRDRERIVVFAPNHLLALRLAAQDRDAPDLSDLDGLAVRAERRDALPYEDLVALHVAPDRKGGVLRAVQRDGTERRLPIATADVDACQQAIDGVDHQFAALDTVKSSPKAYAALLAAAACLGTVGAQVGGPIVMLAILVVALGAMTRMRASWFGALGAGVASTALGALCFAVDRSAWSTETWLLLGAAGAAGLLCFRLTLPSGSPRKLASVILLGGALFALQVLMGGANTGLGLAALADSSPGFFLPFVMAAGALARADGRRMHVIAVVLAIVGFSHFALGSTWFLRNVAKDPLARALPEPTLTEIPLETLRETELNGRYRGLTLAPGGRAFTTIAEGYGPAVDGRRADTVHVADFAGRTHVLRALAVRFVDDSRLLVLQETRAPWLAVQLRTVDDPYKIVWDHVIKNAPPLVHAELAVDGERWSVVVDRDGDEPVRYRGTVGRAGATTDRPSARLSTSHVHRHGFAEALGRFEARKLLLGDQVLAESALWLGVRRTVVAADGRGRRRFWFLDDRALAPGFETPQGLDWVYDGVRVASLRTHAIDVVDAATRRGVTIPLDRKAGWNVAVALCRDGVGLGFQGADVLRVVVLGR